MSRFSVLLLAIPIACSRLLSAQSATNTQDFTFQVLPAQPWVDTGIDLQSGDVVKISATPIPPGQNVPGLPLCNPAGIATTGSSDALPLPTAPPGALIARLHGNAAPPVPVGASTELRLEAPSRLFLGMNWSATAACQGGFAINLQKIPGASSAQNGASQPTTRSQQLKSQARNAAQVFMTGQFGAAKTESTASGASSSDVPSGSSAAAVPALTISQAPLDVDLRKNLDGLPRRVNDQFNNLGDMVNFVIVGDQKDMQASLESATWHVADTSNTNAVLSAIEQTYNSKDYLAMPMSTLFLFGRKQDFGYEMAEPIAMVASRHHFRIWKASFTCNGKQVWVGAGTHDIGFAKDKRNNNVTHKIDPAVDGERDNIGSSLQKTNRVKTLSYYLPRDPVQGAKNATGDAYHSDGRLLVIQLQ